MSELTDLLAEASLALDKAEGALSQAKGLIEGEEGVLLQVEELTKRHRALRKQVVKLKTQYLSRVTKMLMALSNGGVRFEDNGVIGGYRGFNVGHDGTIHFHSMFGNHGNHCYSCNEIARSKECEEMYRTIVTLSWREIAKFPPQVIADATKDEALLNELRQEFEAVMEDISGIPTGKAQSC